MPDRGYKDILAHGTATGSLPPAGHDGSDRLVVETVDGVLPEQYPFLLTLEDGTDLMEVVEVTGADGTDGRGRRVLLVERGLEGTEPVGHSWPVAFVFGVTAREWADLVQGLQADSPVSPPSVRRSRSQR